MGPIGKTLVVAVLLVNTAGLARAQKMNITNSVHNLSVNGPADRTYYSQTEPGVCIFCHAPHNTEANKPLWNKQLPPDLDPSLLYSSSTYKQTNNPISERSKLCLSCHDGTIALGQTVATGDLNIPAKMTGANALGTDLRADHPISFTLPAQDDGEIANWLLASSLTSPLPTVQLYDRKIECVTCHDPHVQDNDAVVTKFLVQSNSGGAICMNCHDGTRGGLANYRQSQHMQSVNTSVVGSANMPYATVADNSCMTCHTSHNAANSGPRLLRGLEEANCTNCHGPSSAANPAPPDIYTVLNNSTYKHPVLTVSGAHDTGESIPVNGTRHSECEDCHNPHVAQGYSTATNTALPPSVQPSLLGASGASAFDNTAVLPAANEYQVCFKCHAASTNKPQQKGYDVAFGRTPFRQSQVLLSAIDMYNTAKEFNSTISRHNVVQNGGSYNSPSLRPAILDINGKPTSRSPQNGTIYCSDCHSSEQSRADGGTGPSGPHGSKWQHLLERRYDFNDLSGGTPSPVIYASGLNGTYALCNKCHDVDGLVSGTNDVVFGKHAIHVAGKSGISCESCHAPHGVQGSDRNHHGGLIDVDTAVASYLDGTPLTGTPTTAAGTDPGIDTSLRTCSLVCHGYTHNAKTYPN